MRGGQASGWSSREAYAAWDAWRRLPPRGKIAVAWEGLCGLLVRVAREEVGGPLLAVALAPFALVYMAGSVLRDSLVYRDGGVRARAADGCGGYHRHRYGGTQRLVNWRERRVVASLLRRVGRAERVLDVPSGYGRLVPVLAALGTRPPVCADLSLPRLFALGRDGDAAHEPILLQADLRGTLPFASGAFDLVVNVRYLHHAHTPEDRRRALDELTRVSRRWLVVSYYRRSNVHALQRTLQHVARRNRRRGPAMIGHRECATLLHRSGWQVRCERAVIPWIHAHRVVLLERVSP